MPWEGANVAAQNQAPEGGALMWIGDFFHWVGGLFGGSKPHPEPAPPPQAQLPQAPPVANPPGPCLDRVLLVGINRYPAPNALLGCVNDVSSIKEFLMADFGFQGAAFMTILDEEATTARILEGLKWLVGTPAGGRAYFHYSGHGAQVPTGDPRDPSALFQVICPVDFDWSMGRMITDKQFVAIFKDMAKGVKFYWGSDSCHSGGLDRELSRVLTLHPRYMRPTPRIAESIAIANSKGISCERAFVGGAIDVGFLSGCRSDQTSADAFIGGAPCGAFTYYMVKVMRENPGKTLDELASIMRNKLSAAGYSQQPQSEGPRAGMPFMS